MQILLLLSSSIWIKMLLPNSSRYCNSSLIVLEGEIYYLYNKNMDRYFKIKVLETNKRLSQLDKNTLH